MTPEYKHAMWVEHEADYQAAAWPTELEDECSRCGCSESWCDCTPVCKECGNYVENCDCVGE